MARNVRGDREAAAALRQLGTLLGSPAASAARQALKPTLAAARENAPEETGALKRSLTIKKSSRSSRLRSTHLVGPSTATVGKDGRRPVKYAHLVEFVRTLPDGRRVPGSRFLTKAFESTKDSVLAEFNRLFGPAIEKQAAKLGKRK